MNGSYHLVWQDDFNGHYLNLRNWNIEQHPPGWVNHELQRYTADRNNVFVANSRLILQAKKYRGSDGKTHYTSGRVSTQWKRDFTYGRFEARIRVPEGRGLLPAFWLMTTDESVHGTWPRCGEIDIMEVLGHQPDATYGTIHYGNPHEQKQKSLTLRHGYFSDDFHVFGLEWTPGCLRWLVDDVCYYVENNWFSTTEGRELLPFPAPFNHEFYIILNLAVGGDWPGNPDETTDFSNVRMEVDWVRVYQKN